jgi:DNA-binding NtrC family response regulator
MTYLETVLCPIISVISKRRWMSGNMKRDANILDTIRRAVQKPRVLIVEDNHIIASNVGQILKDYGCDVVGPEVTVGGALKILGCAKIDIALVDFILEDGPAERLLDDLNKRNIPFALCTGADLAALYPHTPLLSKPFATKDVITVVNSLMAARLATSRP